MRTMGNGRAGTAARPKLKRSLGLWMATALVVGNMVGSGIFTLPAVLAGEAGPASILSLVFTGIGAMLLALVFATLGRAYPKTGGPYYFARRAFGDEVVDHYLHFLKTEQRKFQETVTCWERARFFERG